MRQLEESKGMSQLEESKGTPKKEPIRRKQRVSEVAENKAERFLTHILLRDIHKITVPAVQQNRALHCRDLSAETVSQHRNSTALISSNCTVHFRMDLGIVS